MDVRNAHPPTAARPQATKYTLQALVEKAARGEIRIPRWQRVFKWKAKNIQMLLDSVARGYPIGTLLLWKRPEPAPAERISLGPLELDAPETRDALWVIDGQQRVKSLAGALVLRGSAEREPTSRDAFTWAFDLAREEWVAPRVGEAWKNEWLPADRLVDATDLVTWLVARRDVLTPEHQRRAKELARDVREFEVPAIIVSAESDETLRNIFDRSNTAGVPLAKAEVFDAQHGWQVTTAPSSVRDLARVPVQLGFGGLPQDWLLRLVMQVAGADFTRISHDALHRRRLAEHVPRTATALASALVFLKNDAGIANDALLPYRLALAGLTVFFDRHPTPRPRSRDLLSRWVWRGAASKAHRGERVPDVRRVFTAIDTDEEASVQRLLDQVPRAEPPGALAAADSRTAATRVELIALLSLHPVDLVSGEPLDGASLIGSVRARALRPIVQSSQPLAGTLANRVLQGQDRTPLDSLLAGAPEAWARSHGVPSEAQAALRRGDTAGFLEVRGAALLAVVTAFVAARTRVREPDRPSIASLVVEEQTP